MPSRDYYLRNRETLIRKVMEYNKSERGRTAYQAAKKRHATSEKGRASRRERDRRYLADPTVRLERKMLEKYGLSAARWYEMLIAQSGRCDICSEPMLKPCVDHRHSDGLVRAFLCSPCNILVGAVERAPRLVKLAESYLLRFA